MPPDGGTPPTGEASSAPSAEEEGIIAVVADARAAGETLLVQGAGSKSGMLRPVQAARTLSLREHAGIVFHAPKELVIAARSGTKLTEIEAALAVSGQMLLAEPPDLSRVFGGAPGTQTLGGVVAANLSGPRRITAGATRDHVMGVRAVTGRAELVRSGGRVLKNVTGLDLCKLFAGSHGTLAVLTEITLKVLPAPEQAGTVVLPGLDAERGVAALSAALGAPYGVSAAAWLPAEAASLLPELPAGRPVALARIEDFAASVVYRTGKLRADLAAFGAAELLDDAASRAVWRAIRDAVPLANAAEEAVWRVSVRPSAGPAIVAAARAAGGRAFLDWGGGLAWAAGPATEAMHDAITAAALAAGGIWMLMRGPAALRAAVAVVPPEPPPLARLSARVKAALDPDGVLNPGRLHAGS